MEIEEKILTRVFFPYFSSLVYSEFEQMSRFTRSVIQKLAQNSKYLLVILISRRILEKVFFLNRLFNNLIKTQTQRRTFSDSYITLRTC